MLISIAGRAYDALTGALAELKLLRTSVIPNARSAAETIQSGYLQGRFTLAGPSLAAVGDPSLALLLLLVGFYGLLFEFSNPGFLLPGVVGDLEFDGWYVDNVAVQGCTPVGI